MYRILFFGMIILQIWACSHGKEIAKTSAIVTHDNTDSTEFDVVILDSGFDQWYSLNYSPAKDRSDEYYRNKNLMAVGNWNDYYRAGNSRVIDSFIDYRPDVIYGIEVNRKLFWYFTYFEENYMINLF